MNSNAVSSPRNSTDRVRRYRQRRAAGVKFVANLQIAITDELVAGLIRRGLLVPQLGPEGERRVTRNQINEALREILSCGP